MQFRPLIRRLTPWLTAYLLLVSVGLPLQRVYCACVGEQWLTVLPEGKHTCQHEEAIKTVCHEHAVSSCCQAPTPSHESSCVSNNCGDAEVLIAQLDADFTEETSSFAVNLVAVLPPTIAVNWFAKPEPTASALLRGPPPPPPLAGRQLLVAHQTFLI